MTSEAMTSDIADRIRRYALDGSDADLQRLLHIAELMAGTTRSAIAMAAPEPGWRAIECGCGPLGALAVLAEAVGPTGTVLGVDFNETTVGRARAVVGALGLDNVDVIAGDVHDLEVDALDGPFDLAYTRCFLMHQRDPQHTLTRIAGLVRPGGWIISQEPLSIRTPVAFPPHPALQQYWDLMYDVIEKLGGSAETTERLPELARQAGLEVVATDGSFAAIAPEFGFAVHASTMAATRDRAIQSGVATADEVDAIVASLQAAAGERTAGWVSSPFFLSLALRKP